MPISEASDETPAARTDDVTFRRRIHRRCFEHVHRRRVYIYIICIMFIHRVAGLTRPPKGVDVQLLSVARLMRCTKFWHPSNPPITGSQPWS